MTQLSLGAVCFALFLAFLRLDKPFFAGAAFAGFLVYVGLWIYSIGD